MTSFLSRSSSITLPDGVLDAHHWAFLSASAPWQCFFASTAELISNDSTWTCYMQLGSSSELAW